jgi:preprotein translocase subunit SecF
MTMGKWYDKNYKKVLVVPIILLAVCLVYLYVFYSRTGDLINRDTSLSGGTTITLQGNYSSQGLEQALKSEIPDVQVREIADVYSGKQLALIISSSVSQDELTKAVENQLGIKLTPQNSNVEFSGPALGSNFYKQLAIALISAFLLMSLVIFCLFGQRLKYKLILAAFTLLAIFLLLKSYFFIAAPLVILIFLSYLFLSLPSIAVIFAAFADIVMPLALMDFLEIKISAAGIAAFLMLIGYSVDTDILLTTRVVKRRVGTINQRIYSSFKTGIFMTITALLAVLPAFFIVTGLPDSFRQIFLILALGLFADIINTWLTNASIIKWYAEARKL